MSHSVPLWGFCTLVSFWQFSLWMFPLIWCETSFPQGLVSLMLILTLLELAVTISVSVMWCLGNISGSRKVSLYKRWESSITSKFHNILSYSWLLGQETFIWLWLVGFWELFIRSKCEMKQGWKWFRFENASYILIYILIKCNI